MSITFDDVAELIKKTRDCAEVDSNDEWPCDELLACADMLERLSLQLAERSAQPVAWRWKLKGAITWVYDPKIEWLEAQGDAIDAEPLYAFPPAQPSAQPVAWRCDDHPMGTPQFTTLKRVAEIWVEQERAVVALSEIVHPAQPTPPPSQPLAMESEMGITFGDHLIDSGYYDITPEQEREIWAREECARRGIDPDEVCADGGVLAWMVVDKEKRP